MHLTTPYLCHYPSTHHLSLPNPTQTFPAPLPRRSYTEAWHMIAKCFTVERMISSCQVPERGAQGQRNMAKEWTFFANINIDLVCFNVVCATTLGSIKCVVHVSKVCRVLVMIGYSSCIPVDTTSGAFNKCQNSKSKTDGRPMPYLGQSLTTPKLQSNFCTCIFVTKYFLHL